MDCAAKETLSPSMRYDDRLATVLRLTPAGEHVARVQYRQLIDLLGTSPSDARGTLLDEAYLRLARLSAQIPPAQRAAALREPGMRLRSPRLVASLAQDDLGVAVAAMQSASLADEQWLDLIPALPVPVRALLAGRSDLGPGPRGLLARLGVGARGLPDVADAPGSGADSIAAQPDAPLAAAPAASPAAEGIGAIVRRIAEFRRAREGQSDAPRLPLGEEHFAATPAPRTFDFASDAEGRVTWADAAIAPMVVGLTLGDLAAPGLAAAIRLQQPIRAIAVTLPGAEAIAGAWQVDAAPGFDLAGGRFGGFVGRFRRPAAAPAATPAQPARDNEAERLRQLLHELRTPVNAIQGFAEIIQQQLFSPVPHEYRALAAAIAGDSARMLAGFDELERFARLDSGAMRLATGEADLAGCVVATARRLEARGKAFRIDLADDGAIPLVALAPVEAERLCWRLLVAVASVAAEGEIVALALGASDGVAGLAIRLPAALAGLDTSALFQTGPPDTPSTAAPDARAPLSSGMFGAGFALRLAALEARAAGGILEHRDGVLWLTLPIAPGGAAAGGDGDLIPMASGTVVQPAA